jgi:hypothetical protein
MSDQICLGFHSFGTCTTQFAVSLAGAIRYEGQRITSLIHVPSPYVTEARNKVIKRFMTKTKASHLLMLDVDLQFQEDAVSRTLHDLKKVGAGVMFGCYALGDFRPSIFSNPPPGGHLPTVASDLQHGQIYQIYAGSTGWLLATREALQQIWNKFHTEHWPWFDHDAENADQLRDGELYRGTDNSIRIGEDFSFSKRAREAGLKVFGTTSPLLIHDKYQPLLPHFQEDAAKAVGLGVNFIGNDNAQSVRSDEKQVRPNDVPQSGEDKGGENLQLPQRLTPPSGEAQQIGENNEDKVTEGPVVSA